jgi:hypothetical protein
MESRGFGNAQKTRLPGGSPRPHPRPSRHANTPIVKMHIIGLGFIGLGFIGLGFIQMILI